MTTARAVVRTSAAVLLLTGAAAPLHAGASSPASAGADPVTVVDDTALLQLDVPAAWTDIDTAPEELADGSNNAYIAAAPDLQAFLDDYVVPGVIYRGVDYVEDSATSLAETYDFTGICTDGGIESYGDSYFLGSMQTWTDCNGTPTKIVTLLASPLDRSFSTTLLVQVPTPADEASLQTILDSFYVTTPTTERYVDDTGTIAVSLPVTWTVFTGPGVDDAGNEVPTIFGATDPAAAEQGTFVPSALYQALPLTEDPASVLANRVYDRCRDDGVYDYDDGYFVGYYQEWSSCDGTEQRLITLAANPPDGAFTAFLEISLPTAADDVALNIILDSFYVGGGSTEEPALPVPSGLSAARSSS